MGSRVSRLVLFACGLTLLAAGDALAAESQSLMDRLTGSVMFAMLVSFFPVGVITLYCAFRVMGGNEDSWGGKAFVGAFFHRLMFICAFWVIVITGVHNTAPIGDYLLIVLTNLGVALVAIRFCLSDTFVRLALVALIFVVLDSIALSIVMFSSVALFA